MPPDWHTIERALGASRRPTAGEASAARAAVALVLRDGPGGIELLFIRRSEDPLDPWSGQMAFPGGRAEPAEDDLLETAGRETLEEVGLDLGRQAELLGTLEPIEATARLQPMGLSITPYVFRLREPVEPSAGDEVRSVHWLPLDMLLGSALRSTHEYVFQGKAVHFPCLRIGAQDVVIWGLTYRMFQGFRELLDAAAEGENLPRAAHETEVTP
jgi:8-oxo-dGTP pyrophosphatase MutT (NUDIX family)